jgi:DNA modification methylase
MARQAPGRIRDSIVGFLSNRPDGAGLSEVHEAVSSRIGKVAPSSVRSYLNLNTPETFERTARGQYKLRGFGESEHTDSGFKRQQWKEIRCGDATLYHADCLEWLASQEPHSFHAVVTDPPYGLVEYTAKEQQKLRSGRGGIWRIPPSFDGHTRSPLPRFTVLDELAKENLQMFLTRVGTQLMRVTVPGANVVVASNPLLMHLVINAMMSVGFENRGSIVRLVMTMRGGDRPKNAHVEFSDVSVLPRSMWEPWLVFRHPLIGRVQDNLRLWKTGGFRRPSKDKPFGDVIKSSPTSRKERLLAPHPSLKPQKFLREIVRAALPLGTGILLDPFAGSGSTLAAASALHYRSVGVELDDHYLDIAEKAIPKLRSLAL